MEELWETLGLQMPPEDYTREVLIQRAHLDQGFTPLVEQAIQEILPDKLWTPGAWDAKPIATPAPVAPGSTRPNWRDRWYFKDDDDDRGSCNWTMVSSSYYSLAAQSIQSLFVNPGRKVSAAPEGDDEPAAGGFVSTGPRDDLQTHLAHKGLKPGTPEGDAEARAWVTREELMRARYGELDRASRLAVRDANLKRYARSEADTLIEEMMDL